MEQNPRISIVIGVQYAHDNIAAILSALEQTDTSDVEVLLCYAANDPVDDSYASKPSIRLIKSAENALIPELWRDGIYEAKADKIATLTAHCIPDENWLDIALSLDVEKYVGYGGAIELNPNSDSICAAIHLLRYSSFTPPLKAYDTFELAADNAVYRRADIIACTELLAAGFWEPSFHEQFQKNGSKMSLHPDLIVSHRNRYESRQFMRQRRLHGRVFGRDRADKAAMLKNAAMLVLSPAAYFIFGIKLAVKIGKSHSLRRRFLGAALWLAIFLGCWSWGEATGYLESLISKIKNQ